MSAPLIELSAAERAWLAAHPTIRVGLDPGWPPFSVMNARGQCVGIDVDLLARIGRQLGVTFECTSRATWAEADRWREVHGIGIVDRAAARDGNERSRMV